MKIINYLLLGIISSITNILPLSYTSHLSLLQNLFNTKIFNYQELNSLFIIPPLLATFIFLLKFSPKIKFKKIPKYLILTLPFIINIISNHLFNKYYNFKLTPYLFIIIALILIFLKNKNNTKKINDLNYKNIIFLTIINFIPYIPILLINLLGSYLCQLDKESSIKYSLFSLCLSLLLSSIKGFNYLILPNDIAYLLISITLNTFISLYLIKYLIKLIKENKLSKLSLYLIIIAIFILYWFR